jgi:hypothetical protein
MIGYCILILSPMTNKYIVHKSQSGEKLLLISCGIFSRFWMIFVFHTLTEILTRFNSPLFPADYLSVGTICGFFQGVLSAEQVGGYPRHITKPLCRFAFSARVIARNPLTVPLFCE